MLDELFEFVIELFFVCTIEISKNKKISKLIRYPLIAIIVFCFGLVILLILYLGVLFLKEHIFLGFLLITLAINTVNWMHYKI